MLPGEQCTRLLISPLKISKWLTNYPFLTVRHVLLYKKGACHQTGQKPGGSRRLIAPRFKGG